MLKTERGKKSIFRSIFLPVFLIMMLQATIFYFAAVYGGIEESLSQNAVDILSERMFNRKTELETQFNNRSFNLDACAEALGLQYARYENAYGDKPLTDSPEKQIQFLGECADTLVNTLRVNETNGIFLILNNQSAQTAFESGKAEKKYGLCIRDMDQESNYSGREDLLLERSPSSIVNALGCSLDSWWEAWYTFSSPEQGDFFFEPLNAAWENPGASADDLAYFSGLHRLSGTDPDVVSYSVPLLDENGYPYGVLGVELTQKYLASLLPNNGLNDQGKPCYVLSLRDEGTDVCVPLVGTGALYSRCFDSHSVISCGDVAATGGFTVMGRGEVELYGTMASLSVYNNNNPFESRQLTLLALVESGVLFIYIERIKRTLLLVSVFCLALGVAGIGVVSRRFAAPITDLACRVRDLTPQAGFHLGRLGITEIDQLVASIEELNQNVSRSSARTEFFSRMSHDMRTPMNAIISFSSPEMLEGASEAVKDDYLEKIHDSGAYLLGLINEVLDMTKIESNSVELHPAPVQASGLCGTAIPIIEKLAQKKNVAFLYENEIGPDAFVMADSQHLSQIVMNLLSNAVKFTPEGGAVRLCVTLEDDASDAKRTCCQMVVSDNGIGMSEAFLRNLYVPFERENSSREGTGLGLSITKKLVDLMGGTISCQSRPNEGTTFIVRLPFEKVAPTAAQKSAFAASAPDLSALRGKRVLVCEDNSINTQIVRHLLEKNGMKVDAAVNGLAGVSAFAASEVNAFDAILMDIRMPVMNGLEATRRIRALNRPDAATVPIIAMTANAFAEDVRESKAVGMNEHLSKPIETDKFFSVLLSYCGQTPAPAKPEKAEQAKP